jgi:hypothetical protein
MSKIKLAPRSARIVAAGRLLYGDTRWQSPLARLTGLSPALLQKIAAGERSVTDGVEDSVVDALSREIERLGKTAERLAEIQGRILTARERGL